jgi:D-cysteine desulfhydrase
VRMPPRIALARAPTPLEPLDRLSRRWGGPRIFVKRDDLTGLELSGNKVRKLEFHLAEALAAGGDTVLTCGGVQSNHCRATAFACARLGLRCVLFLRTTEKHPEPDGNLLLDRLCGAEVRFVAPDEYARLGPSGEGYWIPEGASDEVGMWGYAQAVAEFEGRTFAALVHAVGSGGTTAGLLAGASLWGWNTPLLGVCAGNDAEYFHDRIDRILAAASARWPELPPLGPSRKRAEIADGFQGRGYARNRPEEWALLREVAETEGLLLDPVYTVKAMMGLRQMIRDGRFGKDDEVCFLHTGGAFGLFPKRGEALG